jgi:hypothetical protein
MHSRCLASPQLKSVIPVNLAATALFGIRLYRIPRKKFDGGEDDSDPGSSDDLPPVVFPSVPTH